VERVSTLRILLGSVVALALASGASSSAVGPGPALAQGTPAGPTGATPPAAGQSLGEVVRSLEQAYSQISDLKAEFSQSAFNKSLNQTIPAQGTVSFKRGGKLRWEFSEPTAQEIVSDGRKLWVYTPSLNQVNVGEAPEALSGPAGSFLAGLGRLREHFNVRFLNPAAPADREGNYVLDLTPRQPLPTLTRLILSVSPRQWEVRKAVVYDQFENTVTMKFTRVVTNSGIPDRVFTFVAPKGVATVPLR
jgi:outer membrane lipoprotein carrier protein